MISSFSRIINATVKVFSVMGSWGNQKDLQGQLQFMLKGATPGIENPCETSL